MNIQRPYLINIISDLNNNNYRWMGMTLDLIKALHEVFIMGLHVNLLGFMVRVVVFRIRVKGEGFGFRV